MQLYLCGLACLTIYLHTRSRRMKRHSRVVMTTPSALLKPQLWKRWMTTRWVCESEPIDDFVHSPLFSISFSVLPTGIKTHMKPPAIGNDYAAMSSSSSAIHAHYDNVFTSSGKRPTSLLIANGVWLKKKVKCWKVNNIQIKSQMSFERALELRHARRRWIFCHHMATRFMKRLSIACSFSIA